MFFGDSQFSCSVVSDSLWPLGLQHIRPLCPTPTPRACSNSHPSSWWCHPAISSSVVPFSFHLQSFTASGPLPMSQFFASGGQSIGASASASVLPMNIQDWFPLGLTGLISLLSKGLKTSLAAYLRHTSSLLRNPMFIQDYLCCVLEGESWREPITSISWLKYQVWLTSHTRMSAEDLRLSPWY